MSCPKASGERRKTGSSGADRMNLQGETDWSTPLKETDWKNRWGGTHGRRTVNATSSLCSPLSCGCVHNTHTLRRLHQAAITHHHPTKTREGWGGRVLPPSAQKQRRCSLVRRLTWTHACFPPFNRSSCFCDVTA